MAECLFCKIAKKEISSEVVYEDGISVAFLDINPCTTGHTMVIPKIHIDNILSLPDSIAGDFMNAIKTISNLLKKALKPDGFTIGINHGRSAGQIIEHLHVHIIPRWENDGGGSIHSVVTSRPTESLSVIREKIVNHK